MSHIASKGSYVAIFLTLMVLTAATVGAAYLNLGAFSFAVALAIAVLKGTLVVLFFMHVKYSSRLTKLVVVSGFFFFAILIFLTMIDYSSRGFLGLPPQLR
ncbi:MAG: cytochrome C oxidase subunit IV family protein [Vicinamibacterales bacterium]